MEAASLRPIIEEALEASEGKIIAEDIYADRDFPPFDRVCMDGICIHSSAIDSGRDTFEISGMAAAGMPELSFQGSDKAIEVMTGAILPEGYDIVIPVEEIEIKDGQARLLKSDWKQGANIHRKGLDRKKADLLIRKGTLIQSPEVGVMATVGKSRVKIYKPFNIAIVSTGDELVAVNEKPEAYQIRTSNSIQLASVLNKKGHSVRCFHINDSMEQLELQLKQILEDFDMLILSGGVSRGKLDFVPAALENLNVEKLFHRVAQKPGKPFWFGLKNGLKPVFAFPGNPVSSFLCMHKYCLPFIEKAMGLEKPNSEFAVLESGFKFKKPLTYFPTVDLIQSNGILKAIFKPGQGSGDLSNLMDNKGFVELDAEIDQVDEGTLLPVIRYK